MRTLFPSLVLVSVLLAAPLAQGQKATERYIPIGESPGVSSVTAEIGQITLADEQASTLTIATPGQMRTVRISEDTRIWLDRTDIGLPNQTARFADCAPGRTVEIKYLDERRWVAEWVKIRVERPAN